MAQDFSSDDIGLISYLRAAQRVETEALVIHARFLGFIDRLDKLIRQFVTGRTESINPVVNVLAMNSHAGYMAAAATAMRGSPAAFTLLRSSLESALYAFLVSKRPELGSLWLNRKDQVKEMRSAFTVSEACKLMKEHDGNLGGRIGEAYNSMIDFGDHPNPRSVLPHLELSHDELSGDAKVEFTYIHSASSVKFVRALAACIEISPMCIATLCHSLPDHPSGQQVFDAVWKVSSDFGNYLEEEGFSRQ